MSVASLGGETQVRASCKQEISEGECGLDRGQRAGFPSGKVDNSEEFLQVIKI